MKDSNAVSSNKIKRSTSELLFDWINVGFLFVLMAVTIYPFIYVLNASVSDPISIMNTKGLMLIPQGPLQVYSYGQVFRNPLILRSYANTIFIVTVGTALNLALTTIAAYVLSRPHFMLRTPIMLFIIFTMFFSGGLIPSYLLVQSLGISNTLLAVLLPTAMSAWNLIIMRTSFLAFPISLEESAHLDGASELTILVRIFIPLSMPVVSVMILFYGVSHWNSWFNAMLYLRNRQLYPLQLVLREILIAVQTDDMLTDVSDNSVRPGLKELVKYATVVVATLPVLCIYPFLQKHFVKGVMVGAVKQ